MRSYGFYTVPDALQLLCACGDMFSIGLGERVARVEDAKPWSVPQPKTFTKSLAAWFDEHQACSSGRFPCKPAIMVGTLD